MQITIKKPFVILDDGGVNSPKIRLTF